jgi:hypothetical protein
MGVSGGRFRISRIHRGEWVAGLAGASLIAGLALPWSGGESGLDSGSFLQVLALLAGVSAVLLPVVVASSRKTDVPVVYETFMSNISTLLLVALVFRLVIPSDGGMGAGYFTVLAGTVVLVASGWISTSRET